ncbi:MAG TPA: exodeoxyribonuclease V subunit gamma [Polyangiales bacterium]|nr:exodeoxyribonuclease V subunit gamma [Polyangiales bacterium]
MALQLYRSNCMERLADALARAVERPLSNVLAPECIAVPSSGMERWLALELAARLGVWANPAFPFPGALVESLLADVLNEAVDPQAYAPLPVQFALAALLAELAPRPEFHSVRNYLEHEPGSARRLTLAGRLAELFDRYVIYRPQRVASWQAGAEAHWQAELFRALQTRLGAEHLAARLHLALAQLQRGARLSERVAERIHVFGVSTLPPAYLQLLAAVSEQRDVHLYVLSPCREYYGDLRARGEGHALLRSLGRHSREFQELIEAHPYVEPEAELYVDPGSRTLLATLQSDMLQLHERADSGERQLLEPDDESLCIHACHGPMRELEVLHDQLLALLSEGALEPHQIIVLVPNIADYAPLIDAVFSQSAGRTRIPFRIAGKSAQQSSAVLSAFDALLGVFDSRFGASQVLDLLGQDLVRERFAIGVDEVEQLRGWAADSGIRWGVDAAHRAEVGQPPHAENTWRFGLARLALGYASGAAPEHTFLGCAPLAVDSGDADLLGRFLEFCERLFELREELQRPAALSSWRERLGRVLASFVIETRDSAAELAALRKAFLALEREAAAAGFDEPVGLASVRELLAGVLDARPAMAGFLAGGVTFCQLVPMRSIPFEVVCVLGLNDGAFPAIDIPLDFDLTAAEPQLGDRSRRNDDRQLFLEAILSARRKLILSYVGQSIHDGRALLPSVLISELIDHIAHAFTLPEPATDPVAAMEQRLVTRHALSAISPRYFGRDPRLFSYWTWALQGARALCAERRRPPPFFVAEPPPLLQPPAAVDLAQLESGLVRPQRMFAQQKLGLSLGRDLPSLADREPFELDALEKWQLATDLLLAQLDGQQPDFERERARGRLPLGTPGKLEFHALEEQIRAIVRSFEAEAGGERLPVRELAFQLRGTRLGGRLEQLWPAAQLRVQYSSTGSRHELRHFVRHVVLLCLRGREPASQLPERSLLIGRNGRDPERIEFGPLAKPEDLLWDLLEVYAAAQVGPLPLFENASREYASQLLAGRSERQALAVARQKFSGGGSNNRSDVDDAYVAQFFPDFDAVLELTGEDGFERLARRVYQPLLQCRRQL